MPLPPRFLVFEGTNVLLLGDAVRSLSFIRVIKAKLVGEIGSADYSSRRVISIRKICH